MKDYKLSEIKADCKKQKSCEECPHTSGNNCYGVCMFSPVGRTPASWNIDGENPATTHAEAWKEEMERLKARQTKSKSCSRRREKS